MSAESDRVNKLLDENRKLRQKLEEYSLLELKYKTYKSEEIEYDYTDYTYPDLIKVMEKYINKINEYETKEYNNAVLQNEIVERAEEKVELLNKIALLELNVSKKDSNETEELLKKVNALSTEVKTLKESLLKKTKETIKNESMLKEKIDEIERLTATIKDLEMSSKRMKQDNKIEKEYAEIKEKYEKIKQKYESMESVEKYKYQLSENMKRTNALEKYVKDLEEQNRKLHQNPSPVSFSPKVSEEEFKKMQMDYKQSNIEYNELFLKHQKYVETVDKVKHEMLVLKNQITSLNSETQGFSEAFQTLLQQKRDVEVKFEKQKVLLEKYRKVKEKYLALTKSKE